nr:uncharacterized protein LOC107413102 [Ziziphus jujuba var. spinosa]
MGAIDLGFTGQPFTWCNKRGGQANIREWLDRAMVSPEWRLHFDKAGIIHLCASRPVVTRDENSMLSAVPSEIEIMEVIKKMNPFKSPDPDGMPACFFQWFWIVVGDDVVKSIQDSLIFGRIPLALKRTTLVLIPKSKSPTHFNHLHPISLCNTIYKVFSKLLVDRLRPLLGKIIFLNQTAFIIGHWIGENTILVNEICHSFKTKKGSSGLIGIKFDMHKAYDRVNWSVLNEILVQLGFSTTVTSLLSQCYFSDFASLLLNGSIYGTIKMERGIRQGDPILPYLYIIFAELLSRLLYNLELDGKIHGIKLGKTSPPISHVFFADDILIFCKANKTEVQQVTNCMKRYCNWTGQLANLAKSGCFFSKNVPSTLKAKLKRILNVKELPKDTKYLGNPLFTGSNKSKDFEELKKRVEIRLQGWKANLLSQAGREGLVKFVITTIPLYTFSTHKLPLGRLEDVNTALLCKLGWYLEQNSELVWVRALKAKYFPHSSFMRAERKRTHSWQWRGVLSICLVLAKGIYF